MFRWRRYYWLFLLILGGGQILAASPAEKRAFSAAAEAFKLNSWAYAEANFARFVQKYPSSANVPEAILLQAEARFNLQRYDDAVAAERVASADTAASEKALAAVEANLVVAEQRVKLQEVRLANTELTRSYCTIVSPIDGIVSKKGAQVGQVVAPGQPLCAVVPLAGDHIWVEANFKETELRRISVGQPVTFHTDVNPDRTYTGWVESLSAGTGAAFSLLPPENATGNWVKIVQRLPVRIAIDPASDTDHSLRLGLSVHVEVNTLAELRRVPAGA